MWGFSVRYSRMIDAAGVASGFSLDFKKDFDYETYLLIVENKSLNESNLDAMLSDAKGIVAKLEETDSESSNDQRLKSVKKYLTNLEHYKERIEDNRKEGNKYEENIEIWEKDVQIVTALLQESMLQYVFYEIQDMQESRQQYWTSFLRIMISSVAAVIVITVVLVVLSYYIPASITQPIEKLSEVTNRVANGDLTVRAQTDQGAEVKVLADSLNTMIDKINGLIGQVTTEQIQLRKAEFELLQAQINPHFLSNTLDAIVWLAEAGDNARVVDMVKNLSEFFRTSLNQGKDTITIREELRHVESYLKIQSVRYMDILQYDIDVPESLYDYTIPKITIQPLAENALYHGIKNKRGGGRISIHGENLENCFFLSVHDNGIGIEEQRLAEIKESLTSSHAPQGDIYGLYNVNERIRLRFGNEYGISIESVYGSGTTVTVKLPHGYADTQESEI
ncbi:MAG: sensor histidine kinase [Lachnospiraceae bacterium]|nr:sensor histidine kinase [Lachnospiraceae bacterium]